MLDSVIVIDAEDTISGSSMFTPMTETLATALLHAGLCLILQHTQLFPVTDPLHMLLPFPGMLFFLVALLTLSQFPNLSLSRPSMEGPSLII